MPAEAECLIKHRCLSQSQLILWLSEIFWAFLWANKLPRVKSSAEEFRWLAKAGETIATAMAFGKKLKKVCAVRGLRFLLGAGRPIDLVRKQCLKSLECYIQAKDMMISSFMYTTSVLNSRRDSDFQLCVLLRGNDDFFSFFQAPKSWALAILGRKSQVIQVTCLVGNCSGFIANRVLPSGRGLWKMGNDMGSKK